jgi:NADH-quinone oxidoreductase subunit L
MPITRITFLISCLAIAGIVPFAGFFSKDEILGGAFTVHPPGWPVWYGKVLWGGLLVAALGTAFYMWRLYFLVFEGNERSDEAKHAHESPPSMTGPLVVLALLATVGGFLGWPHLESIHLPGWSHALSQWLEPAVAHSWIDPGHAVEAINGETSDGVTLGLMGAALAIGAIGIGMAWMLYGKGPTKTVENLVDGPLQPAYQASKHKLWVDELYEKIIVNPFRILARGLFEIVDRFIIDTIAVNGSAFVVGLAGRISRWFQNGQVQRYLMGLVVGAAGVFLVTDCHRKETFDYRIIGDSIELRADPGAGIAGATAKLKWDLDGDGQPDPDPKDPKKFLSDPVVTVRVGDVGGKVTLWIEDPISRKTTSVTRAIELAQPEVK